MSSEWLDQSRHSLNGIHTGMISILKEIQSEDEVASREAVDEYLRHVCHLRELLTQKVADMAAWGQEGMYSVEQIALSRLGIISD